ncbi:oxidoreductase, partial [Mesorhizobium sp. M7A.F.Ca.CA.004.05.1.1]
QRRFLARETSERDGIVLSHQEMEQLDRFLERGLDAV